MRTSDIVFVSFITMLFLCLMPLSLQAQPDYSNIGTQYNDAQNLTIIYAHEKLVDATTGLGASYGYSGHILQQPPKSISLSLFGYHDDAQWQHLETLTLTYGDKMYVHKVICTLHGEDRDKSDDLVVARYYEPAIMEMPFSVAKEVFNSESVTITSTPENLNLKLTKEQMDRCRDLLTTVPIIMALRPPDLKKSAPSANGLPVTRTITEASGNVTLATTGTLLSPRFSMQYLVFVTVSGRRVRQPNTALLIAETGETPILENEKQLTLNYGDIRLNLTSNVNQTQNSDAGIKMSVRTYLISYSRFLTISKMKNLSFTVGDTTVPIPASKMAGIREIARRVQQ